MKKFNVCFIIILIFSGFVFFTGWSQYKVKPDKIGILVSKTNGISEKPLIPGEFNWNWQFLLPTNTKILQFSIEPLNTTKTITGQLPSGDLYTSVFGSNESFSYFFDFSMSVTISPENLIKLLKENKISNQEDLKLYLDAACNSIAQLAADYYLTKARENQNFNLEKIRRDDVIRAIQYYKDFPDLELSSFALTSSKVPDFNLYKKIQGNVLNNDFSLNSGNYANSSNSSSVLNNETTDFSKPQTKTEIVDE